MAAWSPLSFQKGKSLGRRGWGGAVKKGILKGEGAQKAHRHCIIQIRARAEPKKRLKGLDRPRALYHSRPLLLLQKLASFRHKLAEPKNANSMLIGCLEKCHTKVAKGQRGEDICTWQKEVKPYREKEKWFSKLARWLVWRCRWRWWNKWSPICEKIMIDGQGLYVHVPGWLRAGGRSCLGKTVCRKLAGYQHGHSRPSWTLNFELTCMFLWTFPNST